MPRPTTLCVSGLLRGIITIIVVMLQLSWFTAFWSAASSAVCCGVAAEQTDPGSCKVQNSAFVFVKPHANTKATQDLVRTKLKEAGFSILSEDEIDAETIDRQKLIDKHYYAIASKATLQSAKDIPVPPEKFEAAFGEPWETVLRESRACNAIEATQRLGCTVSELDEAWKDAKVTKFGGGFYCGLVNWEGTRLYIFNAFFLQMRSKFVEEGASIHYFEIEWDPATMSWNEFRSKFLGPTDPNEAPKGSLRQTILDSYQSLGLKSKPDKGDNGVHASASPFEGLAERLNWLHRPVGKDTFGQALLAAGLSKQKIQEWSLDPRVRLEDGSEGSVFDAIEDLNAAECISKLLLLQNQN